MSKSALTQTQKNLKQKLSFPIHLLTWMTMAVVCDASDAPLSKEPNYKNILSQSVTALYNINSSESSEYRMMQNGDGLYLGGETKSELARSLTGREARSKECLVLKLFQGKVEEISNKIILGMYDSYGMSRIQVINGKRFIRQEEIRSQAWTTFSEELKTSPTFSLDFGSPAAEGEYELYFHMGNNPQQYCLQLSFAYLC